MNIKDRPSLFFNAIKISGNNQMKVSIFYHKHLPAEQRKYWVGRVDPKDENHCIDIFKKIPGQGTSALYAAKKYLKEL